MNHFVMTDGIASGKRRAIVLGSLQSLASFTQTRKDYVVSHLEDKIIEDEGSRILDCPQIYVRFARVTFRIANTIGGTGHRVADCL